MKKTYGTPSSDVYERLCRARNFIDVCYELPLKLDEISSKACFSRYHFLRLFRQTFDKTPHQYLVERRIEKAKELLRGPDLSVTDVLLSLIASRRAKVSQRDARCRAVPGDVQAGERVGLK